MKSLKKKIRFTYQMLVNNSDWSNIFFLQWFNWCFSFTFESNFYKKDNLLITWLRDKHWKAAIMAVIKADKGCDNS